MDRDAVFEQRLSHALRVYTDRIAEPFDPDQIVERAITAAPPRQGFSLLFAPLVAVVILLILAVAVALLSSPEPPELRPVPTQGFTPAGTLAEPRAGHTATLLADGRVLITGGYRTAEDSRSSVRSAEIWDPSTLSFSPVGSMNLPRQGHTATLLNDGRVLITGGQDGLAGDSGEIWDPTSESFSSAGSMAERRSWHTATRLPDGRVLVVGGDASPVVGLGGGVSVAAAEIWDPASGSFSPAGSLLEARARHNATLLPDGRVMVTGGIRSEGDSGEGLASAEVWDPVSLTFGAPISIPDFIETDTGGWTNVGPGDIHAATLLSDGRVLVIGGGGIGATAATAIWDPVSESFSHSESLLAARTFHSATLLPDGNVLVTGGVGPDVQALASAEIYDYQSGTFVPAAEMADARRRHTATLLSDGRVLVVGGDGLSGNLASAELWSPGGTPGPSPGP